MVTLSIADLLVAASMFTGLLGLAFHSGVLSQRVRSLEEWRSELTQRDDQLWHELRAIRAAVTREAT